MFATVAADIGRNPSRTSEPLTGAARSPRSMLPDRLPDRLATNPAAFDGGDWRGVAGILAAFDGGAAFDVRHGRTVEPLTGAAHGRTVAADRRGRLPRSMLPE